MQLPPPSNILRLQNGGFLPREVMEQRGLLQQKAEQAETAQRGAQASPQAGRDGQLSHCAVGGIHLGIQQDMLVRIQTRLASSWGWSHGSGCVACIDLPWVRWKHRKDVTTVP